MAGVTGGELVVRALQRQGVEHIFSLPGVGIFPIYDACLKQGVSVIGGRHEESVVHTAEGWSRVTGKPGVAVVAEGPGHANAIPGVATAFSECSPLILLSAIDETCNLGKGAIQELPQVEMCKPITKWAALIPDTKQLPEAMARAFRIATEGFPGPVHLSLPFDVLQREIRAEDISVPAEIVPEKRRQSSELQSFSEHAVDLLAEAERPVIVAGITTFWSNVGDSLKKLVEIAKIPLFTVERARGLLSDDHPYCFGDGYASVNPVAANLHHADVVMLLGDKIDCRFAYGAAFGHAKIIHSCPEAQEIGRNVSVALGLAADASTVVRGLCDAAGDREWSEKTAWTDELRGIRRRHRAEMRKLAADDATPLHPVRIAKEVDRFLGETDILAFDGGDFSGWVRASLRARRPGGWQLGTVLGHLGTGLPYALGAKLASPESRVVLLTGDGSLGFCMMEFETAVRHNLPIVVVVGNDSAWGIEEYFQEGWFEQNQRVATRLTNVRWDRMAEAMGGRGELVETADELQSALHRAFESGRPTCLNITTRLTPSPLAEAFSRIFKRRRAKIRRGQNRANAGGT